MDVREKLVELKKVLRECLHFNYDEFSCNMSLDVDLTAENLISHGVTVQQEALLYWKPVKPGEWHLTCSACDSHLVCKENANFCPECGAKFVFPEAVMLQPPKGE